MSTPLSSPPKRKPTTRSTKSKPGRVTAVIDLDLESSPVLRGVKRKSQSDSSSEPASKKMAEGQILDAIKGVKASVSAMENQLKTFTTKADLSCMVEEIKNVRDSVQVNSANIEKLFEMRQDDQDRLVKRVEEIVDGKLLREKKSKQSEKAASNLTAENELQFLKSRRSIRIWPVSELGCLDKNVRSFLKRYLKVPPEVADKLSFEHLERLDQMRRSKISHEVLVRFSTSQTRDVIKSYAPNLADAGGKAGLRLDIPDYLRGLFRQFEAHGADLREKYGSVRRAVRLDDVSRGLTMDVKLQDTNWHTITAEEIREVWNAKKKKKDNLAGLSGPSRAEKARILLKTNRKEDQQEESGDEKDDADFASFEEEN